MLPYSEPTGEQITLFRSRRAPWQQSSRKEQAEIAESVTAALRKAGKSGAAMPNAA